tara:strand:- start:272 stop:646 length:375 start_codon:yes stop_codon:yes gene_type:complete
MLVKIPHENMKNLFTSLERIKELEISVKITDKKTNTNDYKKYSFSINAADNEGIIYVFSNLFKKHNINIISMDTFVKNAPVTGSPIFYLDSIIILHKQINLKNFKTELTEIANNNNIEHKLKLI